MGWVAGPIYQPAGDSEWWIKDFSREPGGVAVTAEAIGDLSMVTTLYTGNRQPNFAEAQINRNPYKSYFIGVRGAGSFWVIGVGG